MQITIQKYLKPENTDYSDNLLSPRVGSAQGCLFQDQIIFNRMLMENGIPTFVEEFNKEDDVEWLKDGYFDLVFSMGMDEKSQYDKTIYQFFNEVEPTATGREKYFVLFEVTPQRQYAGTIQIGTIDADEDTCRVEFSVTGIGKEAVEWMKEVMLRDMGFGGNDMDWENDYLPNFHFQSAYFTQLTLSSQLDINTKALNPVVVKHEMQAQLFLDGLNRGYSVWDGLKSFLIGWFIRIKFKWKGFDAYGRPTFWLILFWRSEGLNHVGAITKFKERRKGLHVSNAKWIFIPTGQLQGEFAGIEYYTGLLYSRNDTYMTDFETVPQTRIGYNPNKKVFQVLRGGPPGEVVEIPAGIVTRIDTHLHAKSWADWGAYTVHVPYFHIIYGHFHSVMYNVMRAESKYLLEGVTGKRYLTHKCPDDMNLFAGSQATVDGQEYTCERITSYNSFTKDMETEWVRS